MPRHDRTQRLNELEELERLGVDVDQLLYYALIAEKLVLQWRSENGIKTHRQFLAQLPHLFAPLPNTVEWSRLGSSGGLLESPSVRFAIVGLWSEAVKAVPTAQPPDPRATLEAIAAAFPHRGASLAAAKQKALLLDERSIRTSGSVDGSSRTGRV